MVPIHKGNGSVPREDLFVSGLKGFQVGGMESHCSKRPLHHLQKEKEKKNYYSCFLVVTDHQIMSFFDQVVIIWGKTPAEAGRQFDVSFLDRCTPSEVIECNI